MQGCSKILSRSIEFPFSKIFFQKLTDAKEKLQQQSKLVSSIPFEELRVGQSASFKKTIELKDILTFAELTGDVNPIHLDLSYAKKTNFKERIAHGMLTASLISAVIGTKLPGKNTVYLSQSVHFQAPVKIGDELTVTATVKKIRKDKKIVFFETIVSKNNDEVVLEGEAVVKILEQ
jgi:3-hydroxybutyryl-CoA dehydratase